MQIELSEVKQTLLEQDKILILMHTKPDGDALGSAYALLKYLHKKGKKAIIGIEEEIFYKYHSFFSKEERKKHFKFYSQIKKKDYEFITVVDTSSYYLLGLFKDIVIENIKNTMIIDHHIVREELEPKNYIRKVSSTAEIMIDLIGIEEIDFAMAQALYMAMVFDTGQFRHSSTTSSVFYKVAQLLEKFPINLEDIYYNLFENESLFRKQLIGALANNTEFFADGKIAVSNLSIKLVEDFKSRGVILTEDDMIDLVVVPHSLKGVQVSVMVREKKDQTTFSFRSRCDFNVADFVAPLGGGGHQKAAGLKIEHKSYENIKTEILIPLESAFRECFKKS